MRCDQNIEVQIKYNRDSYAKYTKIQTQNN